MNHLAHLFLSQQDINLMVGNFIADHIRGKEIEQFSEEVQEGIRMHRAIDHFTDHHPIVIQSKERLYPKYHKYAAVIVDMFYDHILAKNWKDYSPIPLKSFTQSAYKMLKAQEASFNERSIKTLNHMSTHDWLSNYANLEGMKKAMNGLSHRASFVSKMEESVDDLERDFLLYEAEFKSFFKELFEYCANWSSSSK
ncbi:MAG: DUF479 domain-containing protein [Flavobacteriales bacterium]|nr:DUF479 domain-containing protein [Flavobacteriales bacterium]